MLPADLDAHMATRSTTSPPTSWPAWAQRRSALCRRALSSDTASSSDKPEQRRRRCVAADRPAQIVSSSHPVGLSLVDNRDRGPIRLPLHQTCECPLNDGWEHSCVPESPGPGTGGQVRSDKKLL